MDKGEILLNNEQKNKTQFLSHSSINDKLSFKISYLGNIKGLDCCFRP